MLCMDINPQLYAHPDYDMILHGTVELVYYGHLGSRDQPKVSRLSRCPDFPGQFT